jgi:glycosyltransferase involved in cell wall biosynthesis
MSADNKPGWFDRFVADTAWTIFWAIINVLCILLRIRHFREVKSNQFGSRSEEEKVRIGFCENGAGYGGAVISLAAFLENLPSKYEAVIYTSIGTKQYQELGKLGLWRHVPAKNFFSPAWFARLRLPFTSLADNIFNLLPYAFKYYFWFRRDKVDCVYLNNDASCNFAAAIAAKLARLPLVLHARGFNSDTRGNRWVLANVDHCMAVSNAVRNELMVLGVPPNKCTVVPEGLDLTVFYPHEAAVGFREELGLSKDNSVITLVGGLVDWKGQDVLLDAAPLIFEKFPNAIILFVGAAYGKNNVFANMIKERVAQPEFCSRVRMLGERQDIADILSCSDIVVHASTTPEPFGRTFLEGMALGKAVIASNEGGPLDVISHQVDGLLVEPRDSRKLAAAVIHLLSNPTMSKNLGANAAEKARGYSIEHHTSLIGKSLSNVMKIRRAGIHSADAVGDVEA